MKNLFLSAATFTCHLTQDSDRRMFFEALGLHCCCSDVILSFGLKLGSKLGSLDLILKFLLWSFVVWFERMIHFRSVWTEFLLQRTLALDLRVQSFGSFRTRPQGIDKWLRPQGAILSSSFDLMGLLVVC